MLSPWWIVSWLIQRMVLIGLCQAFRAPSEVAGSKQSALWRRRTEPRVRLWQSPHLPPFSSFSVDPTICFTLPWWMSMQGLNRTM